MKKIYFIMSFLTMTFFTQAQTLVASYPFTGNANDATGNAANNGTVLNGAALTTDRFGNVSSAYLFDGTDDYIKGSAANFPTGDRTISLWFNADAGSIATHPGILGYGGGVCGSSFLMGINNVSSAGKYQTQGHCNSNANQYAYPADPESNWYNWVITVSGTTSKMYINGVPVSTAATFTTATTAAGTDFIFGNIVNTNGVGSYGVEAGNISYYKGKLDDIKVYTGVLSDAQVFDTYVNDLRKPGSGNSVLFDNTQNEVVDIGNGWDQPGSFSFETWVKRTSTAMTDLNSQAFVASINSSGWAIGINQSIPADRIFISKVNVSQALSASSITDTKWHHVAVTYNSGTSETIFYIDGVADAPTSYNPGGFNSGNTNYRIGGRNNGAGQDNNLNGSLDEIRIWEGVVLTPGQIRNWMCRKVNSSHPVYANLKGYFRFDEGSGTITGGYNAKFGTLVNTPTWQTSGAPLGDAIAQDFVNATKTANISHTSGENFAVTSTSGSPAGIVVYRIDEVPNSIAGANSGSNNKYFGVFQAGGTSPQYTAVYNYTGNPLVTAGNESSLRLAKRADNTVTTWTQLNALPDEPANTITVTGESTEYILGQLGSPLPVSLLSFAAGKCSSNVCLLWVTENEQNFSHYEVEKSTDGIVFSRLTNLAARNTSDRGSYISTDFTPAHGANYYRLKIVNLDGSFKYSQVIKVDLNKPELVSLLPNPATDVVIIRGLAGYQQIRVIDMAGKIRQQKNVQTSIEDINISHLSAGMYFVQLISDKEITTLKLVKE